MKLLGWALIVAWVGVLMFVTQAICQFTLRDVIGISALILGIVLVAGVFVLGTYLVMET